MPKTQSEIQRDYEKRTGYAALKKYNEKTMLISIRLHPDHDADIISKLDLSKPLATQVKAFLRKNK